MSDDFQAVQSVQIDGIALKYRLPPGVGPHPVILMLHGWTGDEDSMWVFASKMPQDCLLIAPRGLFVSSIGGFGWYRDGVGQWPDLEDFKDGTQAIQEIIDSARFSNVADFSDLRIVGFSQGAALAYSYAIESRGRMRAIAGLSGFVPDGIQTERAPSTLAGLPVFVAHGTHDKIVPVERARAGVSILQGLGAEVLYCENDAGHRLSADCFRSLQEFFRDH
jgi:phospholipase/carboxylesterase